MNSIISKIRGFNNSKIDPTIINDEQLDQLVLYALKVIEENIEGDFVEFGCYVGESSKYLRKTLDETKSYRDLYVYDSFEGLPPLSEHEIGMGWRPGTLDTTEEILISNFKNNKLKPPIITKGWFKDIPEYKIPDKISFAFLDGDFFDSIYDSLSKIYDKVSEGGYILFHDYERDDLPGVRLAIEKFLKERDIEYTVFSACEQVGVLQKTNKAIKVKSSVSNNNTTIVTGLWNIGRRERGFQHYIDNFKLFLDIPQNLFIYIPKEYEHLVWEKRSPDNTYVKIYELEDVKNMYSPFWDRTQAIRTNPKWYNQTGENGWLSSSPQATLEWYNPIVQSKMFLLNDVTIWNPFNTDYFYWLDAGITNTVSYNHLVENNVLDKLTKYSNPFLFLSYPYEANDEIHGFNFGEMNKYSNSKVNYVCRGGLFGGHKQQINEANATYYSLLDKTLNEGLMGTEESLFTIMSYNEPNLYRRYELDGSGLIGKFTQALLDDDVKLVRININDINLKFTDKDVEGLKTNLYVLTFNFPDQLLHTIGSMQKVPEWLQKPKLVLLDNSTDEDAKVKNREIAELYNFEYVDLGGNTGICGGRQAAAEHFDKSDADYYFFFEDDMTINSDEVQGQFCRNGFRKYISNLYNIVHKIMLKNKFDFLKLSFTEVYFDNDKQCSWYNVPQHIRTQYWPHYDRLPVQGLDPNVPLTTFKNMRVLDEVSYLDGEIYYANWPMIVSREGNKKMFIDTKWAHPFEQTWMSHMYQLTKEDKLKPGILLASPILHDRIQYYKPEERREN